MNNIIYVCGTYFHVLITLIKTLKTKDNVTIVLESTIPEYDKLAKKLKDSKLFKKVYKFDIEPVLKEFNKRKIETRIFRTNQMIKLFEEYSDIDFTKYDEIYLYNDWTLIGAYLMDKKIYFHLIEDGQDTFLHRKNMTVQLYDSQKFMDRFKRKIKKIFHMGYEFIAQSKYIIDIEVNNKDGISIKNKVIKEVRKKDLYDSLNKKEKKLIYDIFVSEQVKNNKNTKNILILTQPLYIDKLVSSQEIQNKIYMDIVDQYKNYNVFIKAHPRDIIDYKELNPNIHIIPKNIPMEVLNFSNDLQFDKAITIESGSIHSLQFVAEKIELGYKTIKKYEKKD